MISKLFSIANIFQSSTGDSTEDLRRNIIRHEARVGGTLFGPVPKGVRREFFCLDEHTWIWYEEWKENSQRKSRTTRYNVRPDGIVKAQDGHGYRMVSAEETKRLLEAAINYQKRVEKEVHQPILHAL